MKRSIFLLFILMTIIPAQAQYSIIAHRGASFVAPENTLASVKKGYELGADAVEVDVHLSRDNRVMVIHDSNTKRTSGESYDVATTGSDTLRLLDVGSFKGAEFKGEKIPFLEELIAAIPEGKKLVVEIKSDEKIIPYLKEIVAASGKGDQVIFIAFKLTTIVEAKMFMPNNDCYWLCAFKGKAKKGMVKAKRAGLTGVNLRYGIIDEKIMEKAKEYDLEVLTWTLDKPEKAKELISLGVLGITTNKPDMMREQLSK